MTPDSLIKFNAPVRVYTLGRFLIEVEAEPLRFETKAKRKPIDLLKALIALGGQSVATELLSESLWPDSDGDRAQNALATTLNRLRNLIGHKGLTLQDGRLTLEIGHCWVDALQCNALLKQASQAWEDDDNQLAWNTLEQAMGLYDGPFLEGEFDPPEILSAREKLHGSMLRHMGKAGDIFQKAGNWAGAIDLYRRGLEIDDLAEEFYQFLMRCFLEQGRLAEGIAVYQRCKETLKRRMDIDLSPATDDIHQSLLDAQIERPSTPEAEPQPQPEATGASTPSPPHQEAPSKAKGERRTATVAFFDLHGYTAMNERLDPEEVEGIMSRIKEGAVKIVEGQGGIVNQFVGDEVLALFGIPTTHEDDPHRASRAALELIGLVANLSKELEDQIGFPLNIHGAINTGLIVTHLRDDRDGRYGITGNTVNIAAGLAALAKPGEILIAPETNRLITPFFRTEALEPQTLKGITEPLAPFRLVGETPVHTRFEAAEQRGLTPFTGREQELAQLQGCLERAMAGRGQFVTVVGDAGVGKSRLLHEFRREVDNKRITLLQGHCQAIGTHTPYVPFLEILRSGLSVREEDMATEKLERLIIAVRAIDPSLERYLPQFLHLLSIPSAEHALPGHLQGEELRRTIQLAISALTTMSAEKNPLVIFLEDWHWVDDPSHAVLKNLLGVMAHTPLLVVLTHRPEFGADWGNLGHHTRCFLNPLGAEESETIIKATVGTNSLPEGLGRAIHQRADGNPFFIEEICRSLLEQGTLRVRRGSATLKGGLENLELPATVQAVIGARLDRLEPDTREVLHLAAVIGRQFSGRILERLATAKEGLHQALEEAKTLELIQQLRILPEAEYVFKHAITQQVAYDTLLRKRRKVLHLGVAEAIEALYGERIGEFAETLGSHFSKGERWDKAARYCLKAARTAREHYAYRSALKLCGQALDAASRGEGLETEHTDTLVMQGDLLSLLGELKPANAKYDEALAAASTPKKKQFVTNKLHRPHTVRRDGAKIVFYEHGSGEETLLLANAVVYGLATFQPVLERLCQEFRVITVDLRGSGASDPLPQRYYIQDHLEDLRAVIKKAGGAPLTGIGISRGGNMMIKLAVEHPHLIKAIVTVGSPPDRGGLNSRVKPVGPDYGLFIEALKRKDKERILQIMVPSLISEPGTDELLQHTIEQWRQLSIHSLLSFYGDDPEADVTPLLDRVAVPTLIMHGAEDRRIPLEASTFLFDRIPNALLYHFQGTGHLPSITAAGEFSEVLGQFVRSGTVPDSIRPSG